jgi:hypothetical protein
MNCCGTVRQNHEGMSRGLEKKTLNLKKGDIHATVRGNLIANETYFDKHAQETNGRKLT